MLDTDLSSEIRLFVKKFQVVRRRQLDLFFSDREAGVYSHTVAHLLRKKHLYALQGDYISWFHPDKLPRRLHEYFDTMRCLDMLANATRSKEVIFFEAAPYPLNLRFLTINNEAYDVAYLDQTKWGPKYGMFAPAWKNCIPPGESDPWNHIAVVPSEEMAKQASVLPFHQFFVIDNNGAVIGIYDND